MAKFRTFFLHGLVIKTSFLLLAHATLGVCLVGVGIGVLRSRHNSPFLVFLVLRCCFTIHQDVGSGLLEKVYRNGLFYELQSHGLMVNLEKNYKVFHKNQLLGDYYADLVVEDKIIIEVKSVCRLTYGMESQLLNYLNISGIRIGYLVNFKNERFDWKRIVSG